MNVLFRKGFFIALVVMFFTASCATTKTLNVWKDEGHSQKLGKTLVVAIAELDYMREHFENVLALRLGDSVVDAIPSNKVIPKLGENPNRETIAAKVRELGVENVLVTRAVNKE